MENNVQKFVDSIIASERQLQSAEHIIRVILPLVKDNKLLLRSLETIHKAGVNLITIVLKYEYIHGNLIISNDPKKNKDLFFIKCARKFGLNNDDASIIKKLLILGKKHKDSGFEFSRRNRAVIMDDNLEVSEISRSDLESFIRVIRKLMLNTRANFSNTNKI